MKKGILILIFMSNSFVIFGKQEASNYTLKSMKSATVIATKCTPEDDKKNCWGIELKGAIFSKPLQKDGDRAPITAVYNNFITSQKACVNNYAKFLNSLIKRDLLTKDASALVSSPLPVTSNNGDEWDFNFPRRNITLRKQGNKTIISHGIGSRFTMKKNGNQKNTCSDTTARGYMKARDMKSLSEEVQEALTSTGIITPRGGGYRINDEDGNAMPNIFDKIHSVFKPASATES